MSEGQPTPSIREELEQKERGEPIILNGKEYYWVRDEVTSHFLSSLLSDVLPVAQTVRLSDMKTKEEIALSEGEVHTRATEVELKATLLILKFVFGETDHSISKDNIYNVSWDEDTKTGYVFDMEEGYAFFRPPDGDHIYPWRINSEMEDEIERQLLALKEKFGGDEGKRRIQEALAGKSIPEVLATYEYNYETKEHLKMKEGFSHEDWFNYFQETLIKRLDNALESVAQARIENAEEGKP